jgi:uncharacterized protein YuzE
MKLNVDENADALYFQLDESEIVESEEVSPGIIVDFNKNEEAVGVEILNLSERTSVPNLRELQFKTAS